MPSANKRGTGCVPRPPFPNRIDRWAAAGWLTLDPWTPSGNVPRNGFSLARSLARKLAPGNPGEAPPSPRVQAGNGDPAPGLSAKPTQTEPVGVSLARPHPHALAIQSLGVLPSPGPRALRSPSVRPKPRKRALSSKPWY